VARDELEGRAIGLREGAIGAADFIGIFIGEQVRVGSGDGEAGSAALKASAMPS
jgi:hypothetical protein